MRRFFDFLMFAALPALFAVGCWTALIYCVLTAAGCQGLTRFEVLDARGTTGPSFTRATVLEGVRLRAGPHLELDLATGPHYEELTGEPGLTAHVGANWSDVYIRCDILLPEDGGHTVITYGSWEMTW